jgi:hypothetical protein
MLIRSTRHACFVILSNGLTLELFYDEGFTGGPPPDPSAGAMDTVAYVSRTLPTASQGVWLMGETVLFEVSAGQA